MWLPDMPVMIVKKLPPLDDVVVTLLSDEFILATFANNTTMPIKHDKAPMRVG